LSEVVSFAAPLFFFFVLTKREDRKGGAGFDIALSFLFGMTSVWLVAVIVSRLLPGGVPGRLHDVLFANFVVIAPVEELTKLLIPYFLTKRFKGFSSPARVVPLALAASMGFAAVENLVFVRREDLFVGVVRSFSAVPMHAFAGVLIGYFGARELAMKSRHGWVKGLFLATLAHAFYNSYTMMFYGTDLSFGVFLIAGVYALIAWKLTKRARADCLP